MTPFYQEIGSTNAPGNQTMRPTVKLWNLTTTCSIALLAIVSYLPALRQPFIEDDYPNIALARVYGPVTGWAEMARDRVNRVRATTFVMTHWIERVFGLRPTAFYATSMLLHLCNCLLFYALGRWQVIGFRVSAWGAAFFAIQEGHQEAVMWYSACNELLLFLFGLLALLCWLIFMEQGRKRWWWYMLALCSFVLALLSKESSVILIPLLFLPLLESGFKLRRVLLLSPFVILGAIYVLSIFATHNDSFRFRDQSFELSAPFWETWTKSFFVILFPWGWLGVLALFVWRKSGRRLRLGVYWVSISLVPYMFVAYEHRIPSRQTYLASAGLAMIVGAAVVVFWERTRPTRSWLVVALIGVVLFHNVVYLWTRKHQQFLQRAEPTERLIDFASRVPGPIYVRCFPRPQIIGDTAVEVALGKPPGSLVWDEKEARRLGTLSTFCYQAK
jgi:hypothetical protein